MLLKINVSDAYLKPNPAECTFSVLAFTAKDPAGDPPTDWISAEDPAKIADVTYPLKSADLGFGKVTIPLLPPSRAPPAHAQQEKRERGGGACYSSKKCPPHPQPPLPHKHAPPSRVV